MCYVKWTSCTCRRTGEPGKDSIHYAHNNDKKHNSTKSKPTTETTTSSTCKRLSSATRSTTKNWNNKCKNYNKKYWRNDKRSKRLRNKNYYLDNQQKHIEFWDSYKTICPNNICEWCLEHSHCHDYLDWHIKKKVYNKSLSSTTAISSSSSRTAAARSSSAEQSLPLRLQLWRYDWYHGSSWSG